MDSTDEIIGEPLEGWPGRPPVREPEPIAREPGPDAPVDPSEAIVPIERTREELALPPRRDGIFAMPPSLQRKLEMADAPAPVVSAPPPARDEPPDAEVTAELAALSAAATTPEAETAAEPFRRPAFDVDEFMEALESKTRATFDHLYDGMLEARRKEAERGPPLQSEPEPTYVSAPPHEGYVSAPPAVSPAPAQAPSAGDAAAAEPPGLPVPLLLKEAAAEAAGTLAAPAEISGPGLLKAAQDQARRGDDAAASETVEKYLAQASDDAIAWNLSGDLLERAGKDQEALRSYWNAVKYDPQLTEAWNNLGVLLHLLGRFGDAASALDSATQVDPNDRHLWHNLGSTYHEMGRLQDALRAFERAIQADPNDKVSHNNRGTTLFELGDYRGAADSFRKALAADSEFGQASNNLGRALEKLGDREGAAACFQAALAVNPQSVAALRNLARVLKGLGRTGQAEEAQTRLRALAA